jgi:hypothetical protein
MSLTDDQHGNFREKLLAIWPEPRICGICKQADWSISSTLYYISAQKPGAILQRRFYDTAPVILCMCTNCGNTLFFNAVHHGIIE